MSFRIVARSVLAAALACSAVPLVGGCKDSANPNAASDTSSLGMSGMTKDQLMAKGQDLINQGNAKNAQADAMNGSQADPQGASRSGLKAQAQALIQMGQKYMDKANAM